MTNAAVLLAGGSGLRMKAGIPKQRVFLYDKEIFLITAELFSSMSEIDFIIFVGDSGSLDLYRKELEAFPKIRAVIEGGATRSESAYKALCWLRDNMAPDIAIIHDVARPFTEKSTITTSILTAHDKGAAVAAIPVSDTVARSENESIQTVPDRTHLFHLQTPQTFRFPLILSAYEKIMTSGTGATDDSQIAMAAGYPVFIIPGSPTNIKITTPDDLVIAEAIYMSKKEKQGERR